MTDPIDDHLSNVAIGDPAKLIAWLKASDREYLVLKTGDLVSSLPLFKEGVELIQQLIACYRDHRRLIETGLYEMGEVTDHVKDRKVLVRMPVMKDELLEPEELDDLIVWAARQRIVAAERREAKALVP